MKFGMIIQSPGSRSSSR